MAQERKAAAWMVRGLPECVTWFGRFFRLGETGEWRIVWVELRPDGSIYLGIDRAGGGDTFVQLKPVGRTGERILIAYEEHKLTPELHSLLLLLGRRLRNVPLAKLREVVKRFGMPVQPFQGEKQTAAQGMRSTREWAGPEAWRQFFCCEEFSRNFASSFHTQAPVISVCHGDIECHFATPRMGPEITSFYCYPWVHPWDSSVAGGGRVLTTDLTEADVVLGVGDRLRQIMEVATSSAQENDMVLLYSTCVPGVVCEDLESVVDSCRPGCRGVLVHVSPTKNQGGDVHVEYLKKVLAGNPGQAPKPHTLNLVGYAKTRGLGELEKILSTMGIGINAHLFPDIDPAQAQRIPHSLTTVLFPHPVTRRAWKILFNSFAGRVLEPTPPYGITGTKEWLRAIADTVGRQDGFNSAWERAWEGVRPRWERLTQDSSKHRLAFVLGTEDLASLAGPERTYGIPVLSFLEEAGFGLDFLIYTPNQAALPRATDIPRDKRKQTVHGFTSPNELHSLLAKGRFSAVYSDIFFDDRITRRGKTPFSLQYFEMGLEGAVRNLERLLGACTLPFYKEYGRYLSPS